MIEQRLHPSAVGGLDGDADLIGRGVCIQLAVERSKTFEVGTNRSLGQDLPVGRAEMKVQRLVAPIDAGEQHTHSSFGTRVSTTDSTRQGDGTGGLIAALEGRRSINPQAAECGHGTVSLKAVLEGQG